MDIATRIQELTTVFRSVHLEENGECQLERT